MLIEPDARKLGDFSLSKEEALKKSYEDTDRRLEPYRICDQDELTNAEKRLGHPMSHQELIRRVTKLNPHIWAEDSLANPGTVVGFYTTENGEKTFICAFEKGWLPEFSLVFEDRAGLPVKHRHGWRTILTRLLNSGHLSFADVLAIFGDAYGMNSTRWQLNTRQYR